MLDCPERPERARIAGRPDISPDDLLFLPALAEVCRGYAARRAAGQPLSPLAQEATAASGGAVQPGTRDNQGRPPDTGMQQLGTPTVPPADRASIPPFITEHELRELQAQAKREGRPFDIQPYKAERIAAIAALKARTLAATGWDPSVSDIISALGYESPKGLDWWRTCSPRTTLTAAKKIEALLRLPSCPRLSTGSK